MLFGRAYHLAADMEVPNRRLADEDFLHRPQLSGTTWLILGPCPDSVADSVCLDWLVPVFALDRRAGSEASAQVIGDLGLVHRCNRACEAASFAQVLSQGKPG